MRFGDAWVQAPGVFKHFTLYIFICQQHKICSSAHRVTRPRSFQLLTSAYVQLTMAYNLETARCIAHRNCQVLVHRGNRFSSWRLLHESRSKITRKSCSALLLRVQWSCSYPVPTGNAGQTREIDFNAIKQNTENSKRKGKNERL